MSTTNLPADPYAVLLALVEADDYETPGEEEGVVPAGVEARARRVRFTKADHRIIDRAE